MSRADMLKEIRSVSYYTDRAFINDYCRYFGDLDDDGRKKLLGIENCMKIGEVLERERRGAIKLIEEGKLIVEWPGGYIIKRNPPGRLRQKYAALIPDTTPKATCMKMLKEIFGIGDVVLNPPQEDKRTPAENRAAQVPYNADEIPF